VEYYIFLLLRARLYRRVEETKTFSLLKILHYLLSKRTEERSHLIRILFKQHSHMGVYAIVDGLVWDRLARFEESSFQKEHVFTGKAAPKLFSKPFLPHTCVADYINGPSAHR